MISRKIAAVAALVALTSACVPTGKYDAAVKAADGARKDAAARAAQVVRLDAQLAALEAQQKTCAAMLETSEAGGRDLVGQLEDANEREALARAELARRLEEAHRRQRLAEMRSLFYEALAARFQSMLDTGDLDVVLRGGRLVLVLRDDVLFGSGRTQLQPGGRAALAQIAAVLKEVGAEGRRLQVAGHTDDVPIATSRFRSNWELSMARAVEVVRFLLAQGIPPATLSAAGYGEHAAVAPNDTAEGRAKNRRIELVLQPDIEAALVPERAASR